MKLQYTFENMDLDGCIMAVPVGEGAQVFQGVIKLNGSAAEIFELFKQETTAEAVIEELENRYGTDHEIQDYVHEFVERMVKEGVLK